VAALLTLSGGFLDAFTYVGHGRVFANSMTGNVVLLGVFAASGDWAQAFRHVPPIIAFLAGVFIARLLRLFRVTRRLRHPALTCLGLEIVFLIGVSFAPPTFPDVLLVLGIAFVASMQNSSFATLESWAYNSVMTTGNLRRFAESLFSATIVRDDPSAARQIRVFGFICLCFLAGAALGAFTTTRLHNTALWAPAAILALAFLICLRHDRHRLGQTKG
jgi:uncharacterized membrane protein YoaK (UPF0700 family)